MKGMTNAQKDTSDLATKSEVAKKANQSALDTVNSKVCTQGVYSDDEATGKGKIVFKNADNTALFTVTGISGGSSSGANAMIKLEDKKSGVTVTATPATGTAKTAVTNSGGVAVFTGLAQGAWTFSAEGYISQEESLIGGFQTSIILKSPIQVYGFSIAVNTANPSSRVTYPQIIFGENNLAYGKTPASGAGASCMNSWAGCELITGIKRQTGSGSNWTDVANKRSAIAGSSSTNVVTYVPTWYMKMTNDGTNINCAFSNKQIDITWKDYAGFLNTQRIGHFRVGCYACKSDFMSYAGLPKASTPISDFISGCQALGTGYDVMTWYQWFYLSALATLLYKSTDLQVAMAQGYTYTEHSSVQSESALTFSNDYGMAGGTSTAQQMAFFWIQNLWGNIYQFVGGAKTDSSYKLMTYAGYSSVDENVFTKVTPEVGAAISGYISKVAGTTDAGFFPTGVSSSTTTYFTDAGGVFNSRFPRVGGACGSGYGAGPFSVYFDRTATYPSSDIGSRLSYRL